MIVAAKSRAAGPLFAATIMEAESLRRAGTKAGARHSPSKDGRSAERPMARDR
jgi:hypothetical protein